MPDATVIILLIKVTYTLSIIYYNALFKCFCNKKLYFSLVMIIIKFKQKKRLKTCDRQTSVFNLLHLMNSNQLIWIELIMIEPFNNNHY